MKVYIHLKPNSSPARVIGQEPVSAERFGLRRTGDATVSAFKVAVSAAPVDGKANKELIGIMAKYFKLPRSSITIIKGEKLRYKILEISEISDVLPRGRTE